jgi:hypothetical protein
MWDNFWILRVNDRLAQWREFRQKISSQPIKQAVVEVNTMWSSAPFVTYYLPPDQPDTWPDPWELLTENYYCDIAKALGILYTIYFSGHKNTNIELRIYYDYQTKTRSNVAWIDGGKYILNYWPYEIVNTELIEEKQLQLLYSYTTQDLQLEKY